MASQKNYLNLAMAQVNELDSKYHSALTPRITGVSPGVSIAYKNCTKVAFA